MMKSKMFIALLFLGTSYYVLGTNVTHAAQLFFYPETIDTVAGESVVFEIRINTEGRAVNAIDISGNIQNGLIESVTTANSVIDIFIDASATDGNSFRFSGGTPGGFIGSGIIGRVLVTAVAPGTLGLSFDTSSKLLSEEGKSLEAETTLREANANVLQPSANHIIITSKSHPDQSTWYSEKNLHLHWDLEGGEEYSYLVSLNPGAVPDDVPDKPTGLLEWQGDVTINGLDDGISYFTLKRVGEEGLARYRALIDTAPPYWIGVEESDGVPETNYRRFVSFLAKDELSGINHYEVKVDNGQAETILAPYILPDEYLKITLNAVDNAGNRAEYTIRGKIQRNITSLYIIVGLLVLGALIALVRPIRERIFTKGN